MIQCSEHEDLEAMEPLECLEKVELEEGRRWALSLLRIGTGTTRILWSTSWFCLPRRNTACTREYARIVKVHVRVHVHYRRYVDVHVSHFLGVQLRHRNKHNQKHGERFQSEASVVEVRRDEEEGHSERQRDETQLESAAHYIEIIPYIRDNNFLLYSYAPTYPMSSMNKLPVRLTSKALNAAKMTIMAEK